MSGELFLEERDEAHPIRWEPVGDPEAGRWLSVDDAAHRLAAYWGEPQLAELATRLRAGEQLRTAFAVYQLEEVAS